MVHPRSKRILRGGLQSQRDALILGELAFVEIQARRSPLIKRLKTKNDGFINESAVSSFTSGCVKYRQNGVEETFKDIDAVVLATGRKPNYSLATDLRKRSFPFHIIGDILKRRSAREAVNDGTKLGLII